MAHAQSRTWEAAVKRWQKERSYRAESSINRENSLLAIANPSLRGRELDTIRRADLEYLRDLMLRKGRSPRTANYLVQTVVAILRAAVRWEWTDRAPALERVQEQPIVENFLTREQAARLVGALPGHIGRMAEFALETGLRLGNTMRLEWRHVQAAQNRIYYSANETKNGRPLLVPLTPAVVAILERCRGNHARLVFAHEGRVRRPTGVDWYEALERLGMRGFRWHDLRHTWASWHMAAGTNPLVLQKLGGWRTAQMVSRYTHLDDTAAQAAVRHFAERRSRAPESVASRARGGSGSISGSTPQR